MASKNVETLRAAHESWNKRDFAGIVKNSAEGIVYTDNARALHTTARTNSGNGRRNGRRKRQFGRELAPLTLVSRKSRIVNYDYVRISWSVSPQEQ